MTLLDLIRQRRAVKHFDPSHQLDSDELRTLITAGALAPSSFNMQNRHFVCVTDSDVKAKLSGAAWDQEHVRDASVVIALTGNRNAYKNTARYLRNAPAPVREMFEGMIPNFYADNDAIARDEDCRSVGLAAMNIMLMATEMGYQSCPMIGFDPIQVSAILKLPEDHAPLMLVVVGKGTQPAWDRLGLLDFEEISSVNTFGQNTLTGTIEG
ncbi:MAG: nitroreductase [Planctomycetota bacterium]|jgi:nitroreductase